ncbi:MAG: hypothetical protein WDN69_31595 [Aliidongia sp.]
MTAFLLTSTATTPLYGKLSDMKGRKPLFFVAIILFLIGSVLCGMAAEHDPADPVPRVAGAGRGGLFTLSQTHDRRSRLGRASAAATRACSPASSPSPAWPGRCSAASSPMRCPGAGSSMSICRSARRR